MEAQEKALRAAGALEIFTDVYTGTKRNRPELNRLLCKLETGDTLLVTGLDRIARDLVDGYELTEELINRGVKVHILNFPLGAMDNSPAGKAMRGMFFVFAEFEREMIKERIKEGKAIAKAKPGYREGRPPKYTEHQLQSAVKLLESHSYNEVERMTKISKSTLQRARRATEAGKQGKT